MKESGAIPDSAEYWWPSYHPRDKKPKRIYPVHDCKPRGGKAGTPFRRFCAVCHKAFSKQS